jgi:hypothetical protein
MEEENLMEHELSYGKPNFDAELVAFLKSASVVKVASWSRAKDQAAILAIIKEHNYRVEEYTILNYAKLMPNGSSPKLVQKDLL